MSKSRAKGTAFESSLVPALRSVDSRLERRTLKGARDTGDFTTMHIPGDVRLVISAKAHKVWRVRSWLKELDRMIENDEGTDNGILIAKLVGVADPYEQAVVMKLRNFLNLVEGFLT